MRIALLILFSFPVILVSQTLPESLRLLVPAETAAAANERQYLYGEFRQLYADLRQEEKLDRRSTKKKLKRLGKYLKENLLTTYDPTAGLPDLFRNGVYNDATATAATALVLNEFGVTYHLYVDHFTTSLLADPGKKRIAVTYYPVEEVSDRAKAGFRESYLELLGETVMPELKDQPPARPAEIFDTYYYAPEKALSLGQYGAYLQFRRAQSAYEAGDYQAAEGDLELALAREQRMAFLVFEQAISVKRNAGRGQPLSGSMESLFQAWNEKREATDIPSALLHHFDEQQRLILSSNKPEMTRELLADYLGRAPGGATAWTNQMMQLQSLRLMEHFITTDRLSEARREAADLYLGFPDSTVYRKMLGSLIIAEVNQESLNGVAFKQRLLQLADDYPFLLNTGEFANTGLREQALTIRDLYAEDRPDLALPAVERFRKDLRGLSVDQERSLWTLTAFFAASDYHFRVADYAGALRFIDEALSYAPDDAYLTHRRSVLVKYL